MTITIEMKGLDKTKKFLKKKDRNITKQATKALMKSSIFVQGEVKQSIAGRRSEPTSVDTGRFLNSVDIKNKKTESEVFSGIPYAKKLEHGTDFKNSPRRHFTNTTKRTKVQVKEIFNKEIKDI